MDVFPLFSAKAILKTNQFKFSALGRGQEVGQKPRRRLGCIRRSRMSGEKLPPSSQRLFDHCGKPTDFPSEKQGVTERFQFAALLRQHLYKTVVTSTPSREQE